MSPTLWALVIPILKRKKPRSGRNLGFYKYLRLVAGALDLGSEPYDLGRPKQKRPHIAIFLEFLLWLRGPDLKLDDLCGLKSEPEAVGSGYPYPKTGKAKIW